MGTSLYPNQIDNSTSIPIATDGVTPVNAEVVNRLRDAIISIESEGGLNPSGTYGTIRDRLDAMDATIAGLGGGGGGGGTISVQDNGSTIVSLASILNFTGTGVSVTSPSTGLAEISITTGSSLTVKDNGTTLDSSVSILDVIGKAISSSVAPGTIQLEVPESKIRAYRSGSNFSGASPGTDQIVAWNATSSFVTSANASLAMNQLSPTKSGLFMVQGQLTIQPTVDSISGIIIKIIHNGLTDVHTIYDAGAVWSVGTNRSFSFNFPMELSASDTLEVSWQHTGSISSATDVIFGDDLSWFSITLV